jgi:hypothetical protein
MRRRATGIAPPPDLRSRAMRPARADIAAPELPPRTRWLNGSPGSMAALTAAGPVLVQFFDFAQLNSVRALPYVVAWHERYRDAGLTVLGIHSPRFPFTAEPGALSTAVGRLGIAHPVAADSDYAIWHDYGARGWPSLFLWGPGGALRWFHFGEGEYAATEGAIQDELRAIDALVELPEPLAPLRPTDAPGGLVAAPTEEAFPGGSPAQPWRAGDAGTELRLDYAAGGAYAALAGSGSVTVRVDDAPAREVVVDAPGLYELAEHERHEEHALTVGPGPGIEVYALSFAAGMP